MNVYIKILVHTDKWIGKYSSMTHVQIVNYICLDPRNKCTKRDLRAQWHPVYFTF